MYLQCIEMYLQCKWHLLKPQFSETCITHLTCFNEKMETIVTVVNLIHALR